MNNKELIGKRIKELRKQKGMTQEVLAESLKIEPRQLSKLETGKHYPSFETILRILKTFDITFEEFIMVEHLQNDDVLKDNLIITIKNLNSSELKNAYKLLQTII